MAVMVLEESVSRIGSSHHLYKTWRKRSLFLCPGVLLSLLLFSMGASAQIYDRPYSIGAETTQRILSQTDPVSLPSDSAFGEQVSPSTGALRFTSVDVSLPGNGPDMSITRSFDLGRNARPHYRTLLKQDFVDWEFDIPRITTTGKAPTSSGVITNDGHKVWTVSGNSPYLRCSNFSPPPDPHNSPNHFLQWWGGVQLELPGRGSQSLLKRDPAYTAAPTTGGVSQYKIVTRDHWMISCLPETKNGVEGEAFFALAPDGTKYWFDWYVVEVFPSPTDIVLRFDAHLYPTRVEDRFGNFVTYTWSGRLLTMMEGSDGRKLQINYQPRGYDTYRVSSIVANPGSSNPRTWTYAYSGPGIGDVLTSVTLPDGSAWQYQLAGLSNMCSMGLGEEYNYAIVCDIEANDGLGAGSEFTGTITAPSGLVGTFIARNLAMSGLNPGPCTALFFLDPCSISMQSIQSKQYSGPGITTQTWQYGYCGSFQNDVESPYCPSLVGGDSMVMAVKAPTQDLTLYVTGTKGSQGPMGEVLRIIEDPVFDVASTVTPALPSGFWFNSPPNLLSAKRIRTIDYQITASGYASRVGIAPQINDSFNQGMRQMVERTFPVKQSVTTQDGATFANTVGSYDSFARPLTETKASSLGYSKSISNEYNDNFGKWVLGQVAKVTCIAPTTAPPAGCGASGTVISETAYDSATATPLAFRSFGKLQQTFSYDSTSTVASGQLGTLKTVADGNNNVTTLTNWKRGIPQSIKYPSTAEYPTGAERTTFVNDSGWISWVEDENREGGSHGSRTCYSYDGMGRVSSIRYTSESQAGVCDESAWEETTIEFRPMTQSEWRPPGVEAGQWRQYTSKGNYQKVIYLDAMWRPVLTNEYDSSNTAATLRSSSTAYDAAGRVLFQSYPSSDLVPAATGTWTEYDALNRVIKQKQDSELGQLLTKTEYLLGFQVRVTNPRDLSTTTSYQVFDQPSYDTPVLIVNPQNATTEIVRDVFGSPTEMTRR